MQATQKLLCLKDKPMYELTGQVKNLAVDLTSNKVVLSLELNEKMDAITCYNAFIDDKVAVKIERYREKRSLNANNYAWKLITEIANRLNTSKDEVYLWMLKRYGQSEMFSVLSHIPFGRFVKYYEEAGESKLNGKLFKHYKVYKGSSEFDSREMAIFIDGIVSEAKELGIQTQTPAQLAEMKSLWESGQ